MLTHRTCHQGECLAEEQHRCGTVPPGATTGRQSGAQRVQGLRSTNRSTKQGTKLTHVVSSAATTAASHGSSDPGYR